MIRALVLALVAFCLVAPQASAQAYRLKPGDTITVNVLEDPSLNQTVLIRPDGRISLALAGSLEAAGRTPEALQSAIRSALGRDFVTPPTVTVGLASVAPEGEEQATAAGARLVSIFVLGEVRAPGAYEVEAPIDILQALALSGGPDVFAARDRIQIRRRDESGQTLILYDYDGVESGAVPTQSVELRDGDVVIVPERGLFD